jgi:hypothetical protein
MLIITLVFYDVCFIYRHFLLICYSFFEGKKAKTLRFWLPDGIAETRNGGDAAETRNGDGGDDAAETRKDNPTRK